MTKLETLLEKASDADKVELKIHHNAQVACLKAYNEEPTAAKQKDLNAARAGLQETINRLWAVYFPEDDRVENVKEALAFLRNKGFKIAKTKFYKDMKPNGRNPPVIACQRDGSFLVRDLLLYAKSLPYLGDPAAGLDQAHRRKLELETRKLEKQTELLEHDLKVKQKEFIHREDAELQRAASISVVEANIRNMHLTLAGEWVALVEGREAHTSRLIDAMGQALDDVFNAMAKSGEISINP